MSMYAYKDPQKYYGQGLYNHYGKVHELDGILNDIDSNEAQFIEWVLHSLENPHQNDEFCAQNANVVYVMISLKHVNNCKPFTESDIMHLHKNHAKTIVSIEKLQEISLKWTNGKAQ